MNIQNKENAILFFCDIFGTFMSSYTSDINYNYQLQKEDFITNLDKLMQANDCTKVLFSFISGDKGNTVGTIANAFKNETANNKNIVFCNQYFDNGYINLDTNEIAYESTFKQQVIISDIVQFKKKYNIKNTYYADDTSMYHYMLSQLEHLTNSVVTKFCPSCKKRQKNIAQLFTSEKSNLEGVNDCISKYIKTMQKDDIISTD